MEVDDGLNRAGGPADATSAPHSMNAQSGIPPAGPDYQVRESYVQYASPDGQAPESAVAAANTQFHGFAPADSDLQQLEAKVYAMDAELVKLQEMTADAKTHEGGEDAESGNAAQAEGDEGSADNPDEEMNRRSVYVGNVDYGSTPQELQEHFNKCGKIFRVTIMVDKYSGHPKGFAYIEFADASSANNALMLSNTTLRGRTIKVLPKRKNIAGMTRGRPYGRGRGRGAMMFSGPYGMAPAFMGQPMRGSAYAPRFRRGRTFRIA
eukprot:Gregarina_sp_Pseudo_9__485@NODE_130_length_4106_cov_61_699779_g122_i0_p3_GENE_NODE_130_length_4106_cov_61_699779_g122_i0NODE_130_length_4106_cov_61_699779_g122_i0_p3_ORF_typecomplete_len265_score23_71RRM_1/PF00076_22/3_7e03RRM_1/PF00076_22/5_3e19RRM_5/PF13893_6/4_6e07RRM_7/PF16367_5/0_00072RL/PF17797_1/0_0012RRM_Rrp7/PF17799_1/0_0047Nup35_RRM_2/PF14605_6/0_0029Nup35_RRM/PF05172_13/0_006DUF1866/PF08952_11/0_043RRM_occluded/PF16842_5/0_055_NODE_130_length_4106_cov_61_699779_g122_i032644058